MSVELLVALITGAAVPVLIAWKRARRPLSEVAEGLSKSEAVFRADLILRLDKLREEYDQLHDDYLDLKRQHAEALMKIRKLEEKMSRGRD